MKQNALGNIGYADRPKQVFGLYDQAPTAPLGKWAVCLANPLGAMPKAYQTGHQSTVGQSPLGKKGPQRKVGYASGHLKVDMPYRLTQLFGTEAEQATTFISVDLSGVASKDLAESTQTIIANFNQAIN